MAARRWLRPPPPASLASPPPSRSAPTQPSVPLPGALGATLAALRRHDGKRCPARRRRDAGPTAAAGSRGTGGPDERELRGLGAAAGGGHVQPCPSAGARPRWAEWAHRASTFAFAPAAAAPTKRTPEMAHRSPPPRTGRTAQGCCRGGRESRYKPDSLNPAPERLLLSEGLIHPASANHDNAKTNKTESLRQPAAVGAAAPCSCGHRKPGRGERDEVGNLLGGPCGESGARGGQVSQGCPEPAPRGKAGKVHGNLPSAGPPLSLHLTRRKKKRVQSTFVWVFWGHRGVAAFFPPTFPSVASDLRTGRGGKGPGAACPGRHGVRRRGRGSCPSSGNLVRAAKHRPLRVRRGQGRSPPPGRHRPRAQRRTGGWERCCPGPPAPDFILERGLAASGPVRRREVGAREIKAVR